MGPLAMQGFLLVVEVAVTPLERGLMSVGLHVWFALGATGCAGLAYAVNAPLIAAAGASGAAPVFASIDAFIPPPRGWRMLTLWLYVGTLWFLCVGLFPKTEVVHAVHSPFVIRTRGFRIVGGRFR